MIYPAFSSAHSGWKWNMWNVPLPAVYSQHWSYTAALIIISTWGPLPRPRPGVGMYRSGSDRSKSTGNYESAFTEGSIHLFWSPIEPLYLAGFLKEAEPCLHIMFLTFWAVNQALARWSKDHLSVDTAMSLSLKYFMSWTMIRDESCNPFKL